MTKDEVRQYVYDSVVPDDFHNVLFDILMQKEIEIEPFNMLIGPHFAHFLEYRGPEAFKMLLHMHLFVKKGPKSAYIQLCGDTLYENSERIEQPQRSLYIRLWSVNIMSRMSQYHVSSELPTKVQKDFIFNILQHPLKRVQSATFIFDRNAETLTVSPERMAAAVK